MTINPNAPEFLSTEKNLPKGYKWEDGTIYHLAETRKSGEKEYTFLEVENDLCIKGFFNKDNQILVIRNWKEMSEKRIEENVGVTPFLRSAIVDFCGKHGRNIRMQHDLWNRDL